MQQVPALHIKAVTAQFVEAGNAPDVCSNAEVFLQQFGPGNDFAQDGAATQQLHLGLVFLRFAFRQQIHALENAFFRTGRHRRVCVVLVHHGDVIEHVFLFLIHPPHAVLDDHRDFIGEGRVVGDAIGNGRSEDVAVTVLMLQTFAVQRGAAGGATKQEAARAQVARRPGQVADALEAEHRIEDVERDHHLRVVGIRRCRRNPRRHRTGFIDAFLQDLAALVFLVEHQLIGILRRIELADMGIDAQLAEHAFHAKSTRLVRHDGHHTFADFLVADDGVENAHKGHRRREFALFAAFQLRFECRQGRYFQRLDLALARRQRTAHRGDALVQIFHLRRVFRRFVERHVFQLVVGDRYAETVTERADRSRAHFFLLVGDVLAFAGFAHAVAFDRLRQNHCRLAGVFHRRGVSSKDFVRIVAAAVQAPDIVIGHIRYQVRELRIFAEEMLAHECAVLRLEGLVFAVDALFHAFEQDARLVLRQQRIPVRTPHHFDHVPARAAKIGFEFLDDLAVAAHRPVEPLQIAVDDKHQVVEFLAAGQ